MSAEKILIVEDEQPLAKIMASALKRMGYEVVGAMATGEEAVEASGKLTPDIVLMDIELQGEMNGIEAAMRIRSHYNIPSIFVTGGASDDAMRRARSAEPLGFVPKPFTARALKGAIEAGLHSYRAMRAKARLEIEKLRERYQELFENMAQGVFQIDGTGRFTLANPAFARILGYTSPEELLEFCGDARSHFADPKRYDYLLNALRAHGRVNNFEYEALRKDGGRVWLSQNARSLPAGRPEDAHLEGIVLDITEQKRAEDARKSLLTRMTAILAAVPDIVMEVDVNKVYRWANKAGFDFFGEDVIGKEAAFYFVGDQDTYDSVGCLFSGEKDSVYVESWQRRKDGQKRLLAWRCHTLKDAAGKVIGVLSSARDITEKDAVEKERIRSLARQVLINQLQRDLLGSGDLQSKLKLIANGMVDIFETDLCLVWCAEEGDVCESICPHGFLQGSPGSCPDKKQCLGLAVAAARGDSIDDTIPRRLPLGAYAMGGIVFDDRRSVFRRDLTLDSELPGFEWAKAMGMESLAAFQILSADGEVLGVLSVCSRRAIGEDELAQMELLSSTAAQVILGAQAYAASRQSEERFRLIAETIDEVFWMSDVVEGKMLYVSPAFERVWGRSRQPVLEDRSAIRHSLHPDDAGRALEAFNLQKEGCPYDVEYRVVRPDGTVRQIWDRGFPVPNAQGQARIYVGVAQDVTEWRKAEEKLRKSSEYLNRLLNCIGEPVFVKDRQHRFLFSNDASCAFAGAPREELIGKTGIDNLDKKTLDLIFEGEERVFQTGGADISIEELKRKDGTKHFVLVHKTLLTDADGNQQLVGTLRDITELKRIENELRESQERLSSIINAAQDGVLMLDEDGRVTLFSPSAERITGFSSLEVLGTDFFRISEPNSMLQDYRSLLSEPQSQDQACSYGRTIEMELKHKDGKDISVELSLAPLRYKDGFGAVGILRDITERKRIQEERDRMETQLLQAQKLEAIGQLAAGIAHEINTPTQYVGDNTRFLKEAFEDISKVLDSYRRLFEANREGRIDLRLLEETEAVITSVDLDYLAEEAPKAIAQSLEGVNRIAGIVRAMKEFSHPGGQEKQAVDLNHAIENTVTVCRNEWKYVAEMELDLDPTLPSVPCLVGEINQVFLNLIVNAAHAISEATGGGERGKGKIGITTRQDGDWVEVRISDTGTGIPEKYRSKIFTPFFTTKGVGKGTGQGLAISHSVVVGKHKGKLEFQTEVGKGTTFFVRLPLSDPKLEAIQANGIQ